MSVDEAKKNIQSIFRDGLAVIVGSGLSTAEGLPSMTGLANHLISALDGKLAEPHRSNWEQISAALSTGVGLEQALTDIEPDEEVLSLIKEETATLFRTNERAIITEVVKEAKFLRFTHLIRAFPPSSAVIPIITTNYDRLLEYACEVRGYCVDSMFVGNYLGKLDRKESTLSFCRGYKTRQNKVVLEYAQRFKVLKPHGSLDWYYLGGRPIRCSADLNMTPLIIPPGASKYRAGYDQPFDVHREQANYEIDRASRYLIIGYGFNDDHLQTHLDKNLRDGKPCLVVTKELSPSGSSLFKSCTNVTALTEKKGHPKCTEYRNFDGSVRDLDGGLWDIENLVKEVLL